MFCMNCGKPLPDGAKFCNYCGAPQNAISSVGAVSGVNNINQNTKFVPGACTNCGASLLVDPSMQAAICPACGVPYVVQQAINNFNIHSPGNSNTVNTVISRSYSVILTSFGDSKMGVIKAYKDFKACGLAEAKDFVESIPREVLRTDSRFEAEKAAEHFKSAGGMVEIKQ